MFQLQNLHVTFAHKKTFRAHLFVFHDLGSKPTLPKVVILLPYKIDRLSKPKLCFLFYLAGALSHLYFTFIDFFRLTFDKLDLSCIFQGLNFRHTAEVILCIYMTIYLFRKEAIGPLTIKIITF